MLQDLAVHPLLRLQIGVPVLDAGQRVQVCLPLRLSEAFLIFLFLTDMGINVDDPDNQAQAFLLFYHGRAKLYIAGNSLHHEPVAEREDPVAPDLLHDIFPGQHIEETVPVLRIEHGLCLLPDI